MSGGTRPLCTATVLPGRWLVYKWGFVGAPLDAHILLLLRKLLSCGVFTPLACLVMDVQVLYSWVFGIVLFSEHLTLFGVVGSLLVALGETGVQLD